MKTAARFGLATLLLTFTDGCGAVHVPTRTVVVPNPHWKQCDEIVPAHPDRYQHFICIDVNDKRWEVLIEPEKPH